MWSKEPQMQQTSFFPSWHTMFLPFSSLEGMSRRKTQILYTATSTCVSKCQPCGCRIHTVHNPEQTDTSQAQLVKHQITCITPYSFIGFTPYSLVCLNGHVLLPWMFDLQELWVSKGRMNSEKPTCTRSKGSVSLLSPSNRNPLQEVLLMMVLCLYVSPKRT